MNKLKIYIIEGKEGKQILVQSSTIPLNPDEVVKIADILEINFEELHEEFDIFDEILIVNKKMPTKLDESSKPSKSPFPDEFNSRFL